MYILTCKGCIDEGSCKLDNRDKKRCKHYTRIKEKEGKINIYGLQQARRGKYLNNRYSDWIRPMMPKKDRDWDNRWREMPMSNMDRKFYDEEEVE